MKRSTAASPQFPHWPQPLGGARKFEGMPYLNAARAMRNIGYAALGYFAVLPSYHLEGTTTNGEPASPILVRGLLLDMIGAMTGFLEFCSWETKPSQGTTKSNLEPTTSPSPSQP